MFLPHVILLRHHEPSPLLLAVLAIAAIWGGVAAVMGLTEKHTSTPEKVQELMTTAPWFDE